MVVLSGRIVLNLSHSPQIFKPFVSRAASLLGSSCPVDDFSTTKMVVRILACFVCLLGFSCQDGVVYDLSFAGSKLVVNGLLRANQAPEVFVGRTWPATGAIPEKTYVDNAVVSLYANSTLVGRLSYVSEGNYRLFDYALKAGVTYVIKAEATGFESAQSKPVMIPKVFPLHQIQYDTVAKVTSLNPYADPHLLRIKLTDYPEIGNYYAVGIEPFRNGKPDGGNILPIERALGGFNYRDDDCFKEIALTSLLSKTEEYVPGSATIYSDACFAQSEKELGIVIETLVYDRRFTIDKTQLDEDYVDELRIRLFSVSPEYFEYGKTYQITEGLANAFTEPKRTYTNVIGGYGVVAALNEYKQTIRIR